jgi:signal transduction histidine kinase
MDGGISMTDPREKVSESILEAQARLDQALEELEHLPAFDAGTIAFAAHALHNYLTVISGTAELIARSLKGHPDPDVQRWLEGLQRTTEVMSHTVNQMLGTAANGGPAPARERVDLPLLVRRVTSYYERLAARKRIHITVEIGGPVPPALGDRLAIAATLDNLISNAVKFSDPGKRITLAVHARQDRVVCSVKDEGPGLSPEDQAKLFQRGARLTPRPTAGEPSTGYGLAVAKELVEKQGGRIWCESRLGHGAQFSFELPLFHEAATTGAGPKS